MPLAAVPVADDGGLPSVDPGVGPLLAVHAHPDDETLATGALLAAWAAAGERVTLVTCTRGERGEVIDTAAHPTGLAHLEGEGPALAAHREVELSAALAALGVTDHQFLDQVPGADEPGSGPARFEDSGMAWVAPGIAGPAPDSGPAAFARVPLDDAAARLAAVVRERRPAVVVTYESGGGYGHPDHVRAHDVTVRAVELAADPAAPVAGAPWTVERWEVVAPADALRAARRGLAADPGVRRLVAAGASVADPDGVLPPVAVDHAAEAAVVADPRGAAVTTGHRPGTVLALDVAPVLDRVLAALRAHATQVQHVAALDAPGVVARYALSNDEVAPLLATTHLRVAHPPRR
ncbi:N-acetyl-1-D-myo-inositol-2-amino-2-deoxy-alpha-D-glucopyranoside deacetylase [Isoptericola jiangsuensis]|uniref:N-acetyl-1-D-myo-inositol-2-amino-2-deoxy-alpha-D-glucopyranoside deacetylase n=1 Tax=Isoptericola jiangsuensis TaxID=548579 RepID=A0A2A9EW22_9MICO|nr:PIG-L family deacetylase [Isoptericola jiangsuensis]PFG42482.1 N-acetyl-1-D-myo-inositol-2-amino-2-deoxy-alpha-D-glucopyranoside deacetylase [Isoptericola jiangsuensis]